MGVVGQVCCVLGLRGGSLFGFGMSVSFCLSWAVVVQRSGACLSIILSFHDLTLRRRRVW